MQWGQISATARRTILTDFLESHVGNDALLVAVSILEKRRKHNRQNQVRIVMNYSHSFSGKKLRLDYSLVGNCGTNLDEACPCSHLPLQFAGMFH
jgi:hypothetical protein